MKVSEKLDVLAIGAHPDDIEICCGGTVCLLVEQGYRVGIVDLTRGELGSRGSVEQREQETKRATEIMGVSLRINLGIPDGDIVDNKANQVKLVRAIRAHAPDILLVGSPDDRHPDHARATDLSISAAFYSGLVKVETTVDGQVQNPWRPRHIMHYMQGVSFEPDFVVDVSRAWSRRMDAVRAYVSQVHDSDYKEQSQESETFISDPGFVQFIEARARSLGYRTGAEYGEGFKYRHGPFGVDDLVATFGVKGRA